MFKRQPCCVVSRGVAAVVSRAGAGSDEAGSFLQWPRPVLVRPVMAGAKAGSRQ